MKTEFHRLAFTRKGKEMYSGQPAFALTKKDVLMPCTVVRYTLSGLIEVATTSGKVYCFNPSNVFDEKSGTFMLYQRRAQEMALQGYQIAVRNKKGVYRVYLPEKHGVLGGYVVTAGKNSQTCNCLAYAKNAICKHVMAVCSLLWSKAAYAKVRKWKPGATRYSNLATELARAFQ